MYTHREALYKTLYYQLYGQPPVYLPDDVEKEIDHLQGTIAARLARGDSMPMHVSPRDSIVVRRK